MNSRSWRTLNNNHIVIDRSIEFRSCTVRTDHDGAPAIYVCACMRRSSDAPYASTINISLRSLTARMKRARALVSSLLVIFLLGITAAEMVRSKEKTADKSVILELLGSYVAGYIGLSLGIFTIEESASAIKNRSFWFKNFDQVIRITIWKH